LAKREDVPKQTSEQLEQVAKLTAEKIHRDTLAAQERMGERPFGGVESDDNEQFNQYLRVRDDMLAWLTILGTTSRNRDGKILIPKPLAETIRRYERRVKEGVV
jgi:hypothetical protein